MIFSINNPILHSEGAYDKIEAFLGKCENQEGRTEAGKALGNKAHLHWAVADDLRKKVRDELIAQYHFDIDGDVRIPSVIAEDLLLESDHDYYDPVYASKVYVSPELRMALAALVKEWSLCSYNATTPSASASKPTLNDTCVFTRSQAEFKKENMNCINYPSLYEPRAKDKLREMRSKRPITLLETVLVEEVKRLRRGICTAASSQTSYHAVSVLLSQHADGGPIQGRIQAIENMLAALKDLNSAESRSHCLASLEETESAKKVMHMLNIRRLLDQVKEDPNTVLVKCDRILIPQSVAMSLIHI